MPLRYSFPTETRDGEELSNAMAAAQLANRVAAVPPFVVP